MGQLSREMHFISRTDARSAMHQFEARTRLEVLCIAPFSNLMCDRQITENILDNLIVPYAAKTDSFRCLQGAHLNFASRWVDSFRNSNRCVA